MVSAKSINFYQSAGGGLGGAISNTLVVSGASNNFFQNVPSSERISGSNNFLCVYVENDDPNNEVVDAFNFWLTSQSGRPFADTRVKWALGTSGLNGTEQTITNINTPPVGVVWHDLETEPVTPDIGQLKKGDKHPIWFWWQIDPNAKSKLDDTVIFNFGIGIGAGGTGSGGGGDETGISLDRFGIKKFYETVQNGKEWFSDKWNNGHPRTLAVDTFDPDDPDLGFHLVSGSPTRTMVINGDGTATFPETMGSGDTRRIFVNGPNWLNTEITVYARYRTTIWSSFQLRSRSNHHGTNSLPYGYDRSNDISCGFGNYLAKWSEGGDDKASIEVEVIHDLYLRHLAESTYTVPSINVWTGYKQITRTVGNTVIVEGWINYDITDQTAWIKTAEYTFDGGDHIDPTGRDLNISNCLNQGDKIAGELDKNTVWLHPGKWSWIRINGGDDVDLQFFSVREIAPGEPAGGTGGTGGGTGGNPPPLPTALRIVSTADTDDNGAFSNILTFMLSLDPDAIIFAGDDAYNNKQSGWVKRLKPAEDKNIPIYAALGNHDTTEDGTTSTVNTILNHFGYSNRWHGHDIGNVHICILSNNADDSGSWGSGGAQAKFYDDDLKAARANPAIKWIIVVYHKPLFVGSNKHSAGEGTGGSKIGAGLNTYHVDLCACGHTHDLQRTKQVQFNNSSPTNPTVIDSDPDGPYTGGAGVIESLNGTGGHDGPGSFYKVSHKSINIFENDSVAAVTVIDISQDGLTMTVKIIQTDGTVLDTFSIVRT